MTAATLQISDWKHRQRTLRQPNCIGGIGPAALGAIYWLLMALSVVVVLTTTPVLAQPIFPELTGRIVDGANILSDEDEATIETELAKLEDQSTDQVVVVTLPSLQGYAIEDFGYQLGRHWGIGQKEANNGILLIVAPSERKVRIEVGRGLEPQMTDIMSKLIIQNAILPQFRRGNFPAGIKAGVRDIKDVLLGDANEVAARRAKKPPSGLDAETIFSILIWISIATYILYHTCRDMRDPAGAARRRRRAGRVVVVPGGGDWGYSGRGWSGGGGGGWSGGGGGFGGGGASGSW
ncbi:MAG: TPM domain-containing protein [Hyphomicrobiaceae bacterium]